MTPPDADTIAARVLALIDQRGGKVKFDRAGRFRSVTVPPAPPSAVESPVLAPVVPASAPVPAADPVPPETQAAEDASEPLPAAAAEVTPPADAVERNIEKKYHASARRLLAALRAAGEDGLVYSTLFSRAAAASGRVGDGRAGSGRPGEAFRALERAGLVAKVTPPGRAMRVVLLDPPALARADPPPPDD